MRNSYILIVFYAIMNFAFLSKSHSDLYGKTFKKDPAYNCSDEFHISMKNGRGEGPVNVMSCSLTFDILLL